MVMIINIIQLIGNLLKKNLRMFLACLLTMKIIQNNIEEIMQEQIFSQ